MFFAASSEIEIKRVDTESVPIELRLKAIRRNREIAMRVVMKDLLKKPRSNARAILVNENDIRMIALKPFVAEWNEQARRYTDKYSNWQPKNKGQLTCIENILDMCEQRDMQLNILLASCFLAYSKRKHGLTLPVILAYGAEYYNAFAEQVYADLDEEISQTRSYGYDQRF
jgi:hypothetical protein